MPFKKRATAKRSMPKKTTRRRRLFVASPVPVGSRFPSRPGGMGNIIPESITKRLLEGQPITVSEVKAKAMDVAIDAVGDAVIASKLSPSMKAAGVAAKTAVKSAMKQKSDGSTSADSPPKAYASEEPTITRESMQIARKGLNNSLVPDKEWRLVVTKGTFSKREKKFYDQWSAKKLLIYQSKVHGRLLHTASPGHKSFWMPFADSAPTPTLTDINKYRIAVQSQNFNTGTPNKEPPFLPADTDYGTVQGGQDYTYNLHLGGWNDVASCISAMVTTNLEEIGGSNRYVNYQMKFGIPSMKLEWHIENFNKYYPANFTIQVHEYLGTGENPELWTTGGGGSGAGYNPVSHIFDQNVGVPYAQRGYTQFANTVVPNSDPTETVEYVSERSLLYNASTIGANRSFKSTWKTVSSRTIRVTAGGRVKCSLINKLSPTDIYEMPFTTPSLPAVTLRKGQLYVTIMAQGTNEVIGDVYNDGLYSYSANFMTNPVSYSVSNISKTAMCHAPAFDLFDPLVAGYSNANASTMEFANSIKAFGETKIQQFVPVGKYDVPHNRVVSTPIAAGESLIIPIQTNQQEGSAGARGDS